MSTRHDVVATIGSAGLIAVAGAAVSQTLYERPPEPSPPTAETVRDQPVASQGPPQLSEVSLYYVEPVPPQTFAAEDLVTIIISERTEVAREQTVETDKSYSTEAAVEAIPDLIELYQLVLAQGDNLVELGINSETTFEGEGEYERDDQLTARVTSRVVEVKPNGVLLLEARTTIRTDGELQTIILSGYCRSDDVTVLNTVQSNQMYDLNLDIQHEGELKKTTTKGAIPRILEFLFNF
ncbi:MAG: flagellar basal body L-ring protein FlgH [Planctomycetota bacterium]